VTDARLLRAAIDASGLTPAAFWRDVLGKSSVGDVYKTLNGSRVLPNQEARVICTVIVSDPALTPVFTAAVDAVRAQSTNQRG
jgi:hypothetical protein